jgi:hypothetical protein
LHNPIGPTGAEAHVQWIRVYKNIAIVGGLLAIMPPSEHGAPIRAYTAAGWLRRTPASFGSNRRSEGRKPTERTKTVNTTSRLAVWSGAIFLGAMLATSPIHAAEGKWPGTKKGEPTPAMKGVPPILAKNLANFDDLDFRVYTTQQWQDFHKSHSKDVIVHWPDGHTTQGLEKHIEDLKVMFTFAPDNRILEHPVRFGTADGEWTAVTGWLEGTFTQPMGTGDGKSIAPTGKAYRIPMATICHWGKDGLMFEEYLFWDNGEFMKQIGLGQ